jgi:Restriction alleviation protein Lar
MREELKPCPFCGGVAEIDVMRGYSHYPPTRTAFNTGSDVAIYCTSCNAEMAFDPAENGDTREHVESWLIEAWNTRAPIEGDKL